MKIFIQEKNGDHNLERDYPLVTSLSSFVDVVRQEQGYFVDSEDFEGVGFFVPFHQIEFIRGE